LPMLTNQMLALRNSGIKLIQCLDHQLGEVKMII
jgi:hypothetical protein